ncbi:MAG: O-acetyl-ADP-ribose deacetylase [FCB group bacterium]|jgi:O-acetyl-ADP-ribose deacetylase (regulator of RNase III)
MVDKRIELIKGDITKLDVDAVVNAANSSLMGGGGVDGAIHRAAGPSLHEECMKIVQNQGKCPTGEAVITTAGNMPSKYVIHTVGPVWNGGNRNEGELLANAYKNSLTLAVENKAVLIAFPNISTGIYGFPKFEAAKIAIDTVCNFLLKNVSLQKIVFVCFDEENFDIYKKLLKEI